MVSVRELPDKMTLHLQDGCKQLQDKAHVQFHATVESVTDRVDTARIGRQLIRLAGPEALTAIDAKRAAIKAADKDSKVFTHAQALAHEYAESASKLMFAA